MKLKKFLAGAVAGTALLGTVAVAAPAGATRNRAVDHRDRGLQRQRQPAGQDTDRNWGDFDILLKAVTESASPLRSQGSTQPPSSLPPTPSSAAWSPT